MLPRVSDLVKEEAEHIAETSERRVRLGNRANDIRVRDNPAAREGKLLKIGTESDSSVSMVRAEKESGRVPVTLMSDKKLTE